MLPVIVRTPIDVLEVQSEPAIALGADLQNLNAGLNHLGSDAITAHGGNLVGTHVFLLVGAECFASCPPSTRDPTNSSWSEAATDVLHACSPRLSSSRTDLDATPSAAAEADFPSTGASSHH